MILDGVNAKELMMKLSSLSLTVIYHNYIPKLTALSFSDDRQILAAFKTFL
jgi:hypothetical protein